MKTNRQLEILVIKTSFDMSAKDYPSGAPGTKSVPNLPVRALSVSVVRVHLRGHSATDLY